MANLDSTLYGTQKTEFWLGVNAKLDATGVTAKREFVLPNKSGTFAMLSDIVSGGASLPMVNGEAPPQLMYFDDGSLLYGKIE